MFGLPFEKFKKVWVYAPTDFSSLNEIETRQSQDVKRLIEEHRKGIERELGCPFEFTNDIHIEGAKWIIGPARCNPMIQALGHTPSTTSSLFLDREKGILICDGDNPEEVTDTYSYLRSLSRFKDGLWVIKDCDSIDEAIERIFLEVETSYPAFDLRKLNWKEISTRHIPLVKSAAEPIAAMQRWLAELSDAHTWVRPFPPYGNFPYDLVSDGNSLRFYRIAEDSMAWKKGVRPGHALMNGNIQEWTERAGASFHSKPFVIGTRSLATKLGEKRKFIVKSDHGQIIEWEESPTSDRWSPMIEWRKLSSGNGYIKIKVWLLGKSFEEQIDYIFKELQNSPRLIVDLRSNPGGNLLLSHEFRNRFLKVDGPIGLIQTTLPDGKLSEKEEIYGVMSPPEKRWNNEVVFLTDPLSYSASEDAILGLQGQAHVRVIGQNSGGGSGRMRNLKLLPGWRLSISTSLTFDLEGNCIEGSGVTVDHRFPLSFDSEDLIYEADRLVW
jgi:carboxyl-terminal processing protease